MGLALHTAARTINCTSHPVHTCFRSVSPTWSALELGCASGACGAAATRMSGKNVDSIALPLVQHFIVQQSSPIGSAPSLCIVAAPLWSVEPQVPFYLFGQWSCHGSTPEV